MNKQDLQHRTKQFALRVMKLADSLPNSKSGWAIGKQIVRSGTSVGANYRATCKSRSNAEFVAKIGVCEEEADETAFWLELIMEGELLSPRRVEALLDEANQLTKILAKSRITSSRNNRKSAIGNRK